MSVSVRPATRADTRQMAGIAGGTVTAQGLADWMGENRDYSAWIVAEDDSGALLGFQQIGPASDPPGDSCTIATFLSPAPIPLAVGSGLIEASIHAAGEIGYAWIEAHPGAGNDAARIYYQSHGFRSGGPGLMLYEID